MVKQVNISTGAMRNYTFNDQNQMTSAIQTNANGKVLTQATYTYDALGNRTGESVFQQSGGGKPATHPTGPPAATNGSTTTNEFSYDGSGTLYAALDGNNTVQSREIAGLGPDQWLARADGTGGAFYVSDHLGSVRDIVSIATGNRTHVDYAPFGSVTSVSYFRPGRTCRGCVTRNGSSPNRCGFTRRRT